MYWLLWIDFINIIFEDLAGYVNETKRDSENLADIEAVQKRLALFFRT